VDFEFSAEQEQLRDSARRFLSERASIHPYVRSVIDDPAGPADEVWRGLAALGATGLLVPEQLGGAGMGMVDMAVVLEELGRAVHPGPFACTAVTAVTLVGDAGSDATREELLPRIADGSLRSSVAVHEPQRRYAWREPGTRVVDGLLSGSKAIVPHGSTVDVLLVVARDDDGLGVWAVERVAEGVTVEDAGSVDPTQPKANVVLENASATRIGPGDHTDAISRALDRAGVAAVVDGVGAASRATELAVEYAKERHQFGVPIGSFQAVQHLCADMLQATELARAGAYYACWAADAADPEEARRAAKVAQAWASEELPRVGASAIQVFGGIGFTWEHDIHLFYKRLLSCSLDFGTADDHLAALADVIL
jgi:alkylation response protein AidB-like acyl-CoA dehydrogenase